MAFIPSYPDECIIPDVVHGSIDISNLWELFNSPPMQMLRRRRQLSFVDLVFPGANHSRWEHSVGAYYLTQIATSRLVDRGFMNDIDARTLRAYAGVHDVGHGPFSHVTEGFCSKNHKQIGVDIVLGELADIITQIDVDPQDVAMLMRGECSLARLVDDWAIGLEKADYLIRDGRATLLQINPSIQNVCKAVYVIDEKVVVSATLVEHAIMMMNFYLRMYTEVYLRKQMCIAQRMFRKAIHRLIQAGDLEADKLPYLSDERLIGTYFALSKDRVVQSIFRRWEERRLYKEAVVFRPANHPKHLLPRKGKLTHVKILEPHVMEKLAEASALSQHNHDSIACIEERISQATGIPEIIVVPVLYQKHFRVKDVDVWFGRRDIHPLSELRPGFYEALREQANAHLALRVCAPDEYRVKLCHASNEVERIIFEAAEL